MNPIKDLSVTDDLFVIEVDDDDYLIYAPLRRVLFEVNEVALSQIQRIVAVGEDSNDLSYMRSFLTKKNLLNPPTFWPTVDVERPFRPQTIILSLTSDCNLRCIYCYAFGGERPRTMTMEVARAAVDVVSHQAADYGMNQFRITFHGGGEPMVAWPLLKWTAEYAHEAAQQNGVQLKINLVTNGTLINKTRTKWLAQNISVVTLSIDGPQEIQNIQRPKLGGQGSFAAVMRGAQLMRDYGVHFSIRSTITNLNVYQMTEMVDFFASEVAGDSIKQLHFEPVEEIGRAKDKTIGKLDPAVFIAEYKKAFLRAKELGFSLHYSGLKLNHLQAVFCGADGEIFCVLPDATISACTRVTRSTDPGAETFIYGTYTPKLNNFQIEEGKLARLRQIGVWGVERCQRCFCKWHCAGHCPNSRLTNCNWAREGFTCQIVRELTKWQLLEELKGYAEKPVVGESC